MTRLGDVGARAARVAHELRVPVSVISGSLENLGQYVGALVTYVRAARASLQTDPELLRLYDELRLGYVIENAALVLKLCHEGTEQLKHLAEQIKGYTRPAAVAQLMQGIDLEAAMARAVAMVAASREAVPTVHWAMEGQLLVRGAPDSLAQAFINILTNAFDALAGVADAHVWISGRRTADAGEWIEIGVRDNGPGVPAALRARIFDAFFTTRSQGAGLGLGLAITREIIAAHGGSVDLADTATGAHFIIRLPAAAAA